MQLVAGTDRIALCGELPVIARHRHAAPAIVVGVDAPLTFLADRAHTSRAALVAPGLAHAVHVPRGRIAVFLLPPHAVARDGLAPVRDLARAGTWLELGGALLRGELTGAAPFDPIDRALATERLPTRELDDRLRRALALMAGSLDDNLGVDALAAAVGLSPSRLMGLARAQLGASLRAYRRWLRMFHVARAYATGGSLTSAAHAAGFASSAHLSAAAREHFGIRPSEILASRHRPSIRVA